MLGFRGNQGREEEEKDPNPKAPNALNPHSVPSPCRHGLGRWPGAMA